MSKRNWLEKMAFPSDLELTKLCAEAMGYEIREWPEVGYSYNDPMAGWQPWNPLRDDAQAMALVKRFQVESYICYEGSLWGAQCFLGEEGSLTCITSSGHESLNRAIVECVAKMQVAKAATALVARKP